MVYMLALVAALSNALTSVLQRMGVEDAPKGSTSGWSLVAHVLRRGIWLLGMLMMIVSFLTQALALHIGRLSQVQPLLTTELLFLVLILSAWFEFRVGAREWLGALVAASGLSGFLFFAAPTGGNRVPGSTAWVLVAVSCGAAMALTILAARSGPRWWRAAMFGTSSAIGFGLTAALTKVVTNYVSSDWVSIFRHWQTFALAAAGLASVYLAQNAYLAGPIAASQAALVLVDPLASILIGVSLFGDNLRTAWPWGPLEALSLVVLFAGAMFLVRSPLVTGVSGDDGLQEMLTGRSRARRLAEAVAPPTWT